LQEKSVDNRLVVLIQNPTRDLILALPDDKLRAVVWHLALEASLSFPKIARLLGVDAGILRGRVGRVASFKEVAAILGCDVTGTTIGGDYDEELQQARH
jgi:hypothetical protein